MNPLFEILRKGSAIVYNRREKKIKVFTECKTLDDVNFVAEKVCELFGVDKSEVRISPEKSWGFKLEFDYDFGNIFNNHSNPEPEESVEDIANDNPKPKKNVDLRKSKFEYEKVGDLLIIRKGKRKYVFNYEKVKFFFEDLPPRTYLREACDLAKRYGINSEYHAMLALFEFFDKDVNFDAELVSEGINKVLVKTSYSLRDEHRRKMFIEGEVIGKPWNL